MRPILYLTAKSYWILTGKEHIFINTIYLSRSSFSDDPVKDISGDRTVTENRSGDESLNEEEASYCSFAKVCRCNMCPDLAKDESYACCKSVSKSRDICQDENLSCICFAKKIEKLLDKATLFEQCETLISRFSLYRMF